MVPLIDRLQGRGLVVRGASPGDRRSHALNLSGAGRTLLAEATRRVREHELAIAAGLTADERRLLLELLPRLAR